MFRKARSGVRSGEESKAWCVRVQLVGLYSGPEWLCAISKRKKCRSKLQGMSLVCKVTEDLFNNAGAQRSLRVNGNERCGFSL